MTAELHVVGGDRHVLTDAAGTEELRRASAPSPSYELTGRLGNLEAIPVYVGRCPCRD